MPPVLRKTTPAITKAQEKKAAQEKPIKGTSIEDAIKAVHEAKKNGLDLTFLQRC